MANPSSTADKSGFYPKAMLLAANLAMPYYDLPEPVFVTDPHKEDEDGEQPVEPDTPEPPPGSPT
jgi:hypothetical protein